MLLQGKSSLTLDILQGGGGSNPNYKLLINFFQLEFGTNSGKATGVVGKICPRETFPRGAAPRESLID